MLHDHIGYDFPKRTIEYLEGLKAAEKDEDIKVLCAKVIMELQHNLSELERLPSLKELVPSSTKVHRFMQERGKMIRKAFDEANKDSILGLLASRVSLKGGHRTFYDAMGHFTEGMELNAFSHDILIPRSEITDPVGAACDRYIFRTEEKAKL